MEKFSILEGALKRKKEELEQSKGVKANIATSKTRWFNYKVSWKSVDLKSRLLRGRLLRSKRCSHK